ncbi:kinase-like domain-containing protein [Lactarius sanguifluus]|nr:kinase-like domain-containing protein [Lactarius sanguifluus]
MSSTRTHRGHINRESSRSASGVWWRDHYDDIKRYGYELHPWYDPEFVPSRNYSGGDSAACPLRAMMDATRLHDRKRVMLKPEEGSHGPDIMFSPEQVARNRRNHCIPLLDIIELHDSSQRIMVLPYLRPLDRFQTFAEFVDFFTQICEGLQFMHERNIAHRDLTANNIMFDPSGMDPEGLRPTHRTQRRGEAERHTRTQRLRCYYLIDCGLSRQYASRDAFDRPLLGGDSAAPEHVSGSPCNPFHTDIYYLGNLIRQGFIEKYHGFEFMQGLVSEMMTNDPARRPVIENILDRFALIRDSPNLHSTIMSKRESRLFTAFRSAWQTLRTFLCIAPKHQSNILNV